MKEWEEPEFIEMDDEMIEKSRAKEQEHKDRTKEQECSGSFKMYVKLKF